MTSSSTLTDLAGRVERLTGRCRETDGAIKLALAAQLFAGDASKDDVVRILGGDLYADPLPYTQTFEAALTVKPIACTFAMGDCSEDGSPWACVTDAAGVDYTATGVNAVLALLSASLRARASMEADRG
jgi:hypothetical protein